MKLKIFSLLVAIVIGSAVSTFAEEKEFVKEYSYQASEADSKLSARAIALEQVKRLLLEELGTYLVSETEVKNFQLTKDKITTLSAGIVATQIIEDKWNGEIYYLKAKIKANPHDVAQALNKLRDDKQKDKELEESKKRADDAFVEIARLKKELETTKGDKQKQVQYAAVANVLSAKDWFEKAYKLDEAGNTQGAIDAYSKVIELDPKHIAAYNNRGIIYSKLGDKNRAIADFDRVIALDSKDAAAYNNRGIAFSDLDNNKSAIADFNRAIELDSKDASAYNNRGYVYSKLGDTNRAIADYNRAIERDPKLHKAYNRRAIAYYRLGDYKQAIADYSRGIELKPEYMGYFSRGLAYYESGDKERAIADYDRAIEIAPRDTLLYMNRGNTYYELGNMKMAVANWKTAARLGDKSAQSRLKKQGIEW